MVNKAIENRRTQRPLVGMKCLDRQNHYNWLEENLPKFFDILGIDCSNGIIAAHGDKCYGYKDKWLEAGIPFPHGVAVYLLSYIHPWSETCRITNNGFVKPDDWVISTYPQVSNLLAPACKHENYSTRRIMDFSFRICNDCGYQWKA